MSTQHLTPMLLCAHDVTLKILASAGHRFSPLPDGDPIARWASATFRSVDDLRMHCDPPIDLLRLSDRAQICGTVSAQKQIVIDVCALPLFVWRAMYMALDSIPDPEGDGSPEEHEAERAKRAAAWESTGKAKALVTIENGLAEILPRLVEKMLSRS